MDSIVRGNEGYRNGYPITNYSELRKVKACDETWIWRGKGKPDCDHGDRIYFYKDKAIVGHCYYNGFEDHRSANLEGAQQSGMAILLTGPYHHYENPLQFNIPNAPWRWRYINNIEGLSQELEKISE